MSSMPVLRRVVDDAMETAINDVFEVLGRHAEEGYATTQEIGAHLVAGWGYQIFDMWTDWLLGLEE